MNFTPGLYRVSLVACRERFNKSHVKSKLITVSVLITDMLCILLTPSKNLKYKKKGKTNFGNNHTNVILINSSLLPWLLMAKVFVAK